MTSTFHTFADISGTTTFANFSGFVNSFFLELPSRNFPSLMHYTTMVINEETYIMYENTTASRLLLFADWPEFFFPSQSEAGSSNASGTGSVRVSAQGLLSIL